MRWLKWSLLLAFVVLNVTLVLATDESEEAIVEEDNDDGPVHADDEDEENNVLYESPDVDKKDSRVYFVDTFDKKDVFDNWIISQAKKDGAEASISKYDGVWRQEALKKSSLSGDSGIVMKSKAKHAAISADLSKPFHFSKGKPLVVQYELNYQQGQDCGGGYIKLLAKPDQPSTRDLKLFNDKSLYSIMFGPDKCGSDSKLHFIFNFDPPNQLPLAERHAQKVLEPNKRAEVEEVFKDKRTHLYRLVVKPDDSFEIAVDNKVIKTGSLNKDFEPQVNPPEEIDDPNDTKPADWDEREKIPDPEAMKPDDWDENEPKMIVDEAAVKPEGWLDDEPEMIPNPDVVRPDDWDDEVDGEWEAALIDNPACESAPGCGPWTPSMIANPNYKGKWYPPMTDNPSFKGKWKPRQIANPDYYHVDNIFETLKPIVSVGVELWTMSEDLYFDNMMITDDLELAQSFAKSTFDLKVQKMGASDQGLLNRILSYSNRNPWLYAVYVVVIGLPLVLIVTFCCNTGPSQPTESKSQVSSKKTDEPEDDDDDDDEDAKEENEDVDETGDAKEEEEEEVKEETKTVRKRRARKE